MRRVVLLICSFAILLSCTQCARRDDAFARRSAEKTLTPLDYTQLRDREQVKYKDIILRIPASWGGVLLPVDPGAYPTILDKVVHSGDLGTITGLYNQSLFELQHPRVKVEYIHFDMWSDTFRSTLAVALSARRAPAYYIARDLPQTIEQGLYADLTDLMKKWDQFHLQPEGSIREGTVNGRIYTLAGNEMGATIIRYRKDWFREAGIFNEYGEPGPRSDWTWDDFRRIAGKLTDPKRGRYGFAGEMGDFLYNAPHGLDLYVPDPTGQRTWKFNDADPELRRSLQAVREMANKERSANTSVSMGWFEWHNEFDAGRAGMIVSFAPHIPREYLENPHKFGKDKPYGETVGMATLPLGPTGLSGLRPITNPIGFDPTMSPEQLEAAFEWCKSYFYGDMFVNRMRTEAQVARVLNRRSTVYAEVLALPYKPKENLLEEPLEKVFPKDYLETYRRIRESHAPPLPREFGLKEPPTNEYNRAIRAMYSEAITSNADLETIISKTASIINTTLLNFRGKNDREQMRRYIAARTEFYKKHYPRYYEQVWRDKVQQFYRVP